MKIDRRAVLAAASASAAVAALDWPLRALATPALGPGNAQPEMDGSRMGQTGTGQPLKSQRPTGQPNMGQPNMGQPFSFDALTKEMQLLATRDYTPPDHPPQQVLDRIDYEAHGKIKFNPDHALFRDGPGQFPVTFFMLGHFFPTPVRMYALAPLGRASSDANFTAREIVYDPADFTMPLDSPARELPKDAGFAGFRFQESRLENEPGWRTNDWIAFLGASYFRAIGELYQYGLSARGVAINVSSPGHPEEFPNFTRFYFVPPERNSHEVTVYASLDGPSVTGAYRFDMHRGKAVSMEVEARLFLRRDVSQLGLAPLTSMYWFSETAKPTATDWRPEVHDSDGLALWTGTGEHIWRPLNNDEHPSTSNFTDVSPRGFGLLQRDRAFDHYLDGVRYDRRPSLWVEPLENWGEGSVTLVELPTDDESEDNIVAMWVPRQPAKAGANFKLHYRLHWAADEPHPSTLARCFATRLGRGGEPGKPRPPGVRKFVVEFLGGLLASLPPGTKPQPVLAVSSGTFSNVLTEAVPDGVPGHWRASFDCTVAHPGVIEMRLFLKSGDQTLSETWLYRYTAG